MVHLLVEPSRATGEGKRVAIRAVVPVRRGEGADKPNRPPERKLRRAMTLVGTKGNPG